MPLDYFLNREKKKKLSMDIFSDESRWYLYKHNRLSVSVGRHCFSATGVLG